MAALGGGAIGISMAQDAKNESPGAGPRKESAHRPEGRRPGLPSAAEIAALPSDGGEEYNRLIFEKSPYLLQHAANPVNWHPWGAEAFETAKRENKPVFLSVGYSTCHWCHVMEHESFEDQQVADALNAVFVPIKVDREERPDIDHVYMTFCQLMTGRGGWPLTVVLTPEGTPFFAGTYFPKHSRGGQPGVLNLIGAIDRAWKENQSEIREQAGDFAAKLAETMGGETAPGAQEPGLPAIQKAYQQLAGRFDPEHGGFGSQPKFPTAHNLSFLLRVWKRTGEKNALEMVEKSLREMRLGGVYDHVGHGFHRYSTDAEWLLPHFEKMLYDQALMVVACVETWQATGNREYADMARGVMTYVLRDMQSPEGGFYSAEDADSEGEEGLFYLWTEAELLEALGGDREAADLFAKAYNFEKGGNFEDEATGHSSGGRNIPHLREPLRLLAEDFKQTPEAFEKRLEDIRQRLFEVREKRVHPLKDDKILTDWNGLMIAAAAIAGRALNEPAYTRAAEKAAGFVLEKLRTPEGRLLKRHRAGESGLPAHLDDYAFMMWGLIELYEATFDARWLREAQTLGDQMLERFWDAEGGGFFMTASDSEKLIARAKEVYDGAIPSGNSVAALALAKLARLTGNHAYEDKSRAVGRAFAEQAERAPIAHPFLLQAVDFWEGPSLEIVIAGDPNASDAQAMLRALRKEFLPNKVVLFRPSGEEKPAIAELAPFVEFQTALGGKATAYVCQNQACQRPAKSAEEMMDSIRKAASPAKKQGWTIGGK
jgi:uncharacterized protein YyaL (SSP411 family)